MAQKIQITTAINLDDSQFKSGIAGVETILKKISTSAAFIKLKLDDKDFRAQYQSAVKDAIAAIRKAYGAKKGQDITYANAKGRATKIDTIGSMKTAYTYALGQSVSDKLSASEQGKWKQRADALAIYLNILKQVGQETRNVARSEKELRDMPLRMERARRSAAVQMEKRRAYLEMTEPERQAKQDDRLFRGEALEKMKQADKAALNAKRAAEKEEKEIEKRKTKNLREESRKREQIRRQEEASMRRSIASRKAADAEANRVINGASSNAVLANMRSYYKEQEKVSRQAQRESDKQANAQNRIIRQYQQQYGILGGLGSRLRSYLSIYALANFGKKVAETTGYFEKQQVALEGILGSASKAQQILSQIKDFALRSPFQTKELVTFTKQLAAFSIPADELFDTTKRLADISAGLGVDMSRIILAYGQVRSAAVLRGQELRQFTEAGIPLVQKLSEKFTQLRGEVVTTADVFELISKRQVSFQMVADVLSDMTKEGGQFYKMQENITDTLYGQMQKLQDMWTIKMDEMGKAPGNFLMKVVKLLQLIIQNANGVAAGLIAAFTLNWAIRDIRAMRMEWQLMDAETKRTIGSLKQFRRLRLLEFGKNLGWGLAAAGVGYAVGAIYQYLRSLGEVQRKMAEISNSFNKETNKMIGGFDNLVQRLRSAKVGTQAYNDAIETLKSNYGEFVNINEKTIQTLLAERDATQDNVAEYDKLREQIAAAIKLKQKFNELKTQKEALGDLFSSKAEGSDFWGTGYKGVNERYLSQLGILVGGISTEFGSRMINEIFGTQFTGNIEKKLIDELNSVANETLAEYRNKGYTTQDEFNALYAKNFQNKYLSNTFGQWNDDKINNFISNVSNAIFETFKDTKAFTEYIDIVAKINGEGTDLISVLTRINNQFDSYNSGDNEGIGAAGKQQWTNKRYAELLRNSVSAEFGLLGGNADKLKNLKDTINAFVNASEYDAGGIKRITEDLQAFLETIEDSERRAVVARAKQRFEEGTKALTDQEQKISNRIGRDATWAGIRRDKLNGVDLQNFIDNTFNPIALGEQTVHQTRDKLRSAYDDLRKELKTYTANAENFADRMALINAKMRIIERLAKGDIYAVDLTEKSKGRSSSGGGWRRIFSDLFSYIKEARAEEKKLIEHSAGLTSVLAQQINSGQLSDTAVNAFWSEGSPFKKFIDKMDQYGLESEVFTKDFLQKSLGSIVTKQIEATGTIDYQDVWSQLIGIIKGRIGQLRGDKEMESTVDAMEAYLAQMVLEFEKFFSRNAVEILIEGQLKEMRQINGKFDAIRNTQKAYEGIRGASNASIARRVLGTGGIISNADVTTRQLAAMLSIGYGKGLAEASPALKQLVNGGKLGIASISQLLAIRQDLAGKTTKDMTGKDKAERQANFEEFKNVLSEFDKLLSQLTNDILDDYRRLMELREPARKASDDIINAYNKFEERREAIVLGIAKGDIKDEAGGMLVTATQELYAAIAKSLGGNGMPEYINRLFGADYTKTGVIGQGFGLGMWLGDGDFMQKTANYIASLGDVSEETVKKIQDFADRMALTSAIIKRVDDYTQKAAQFANQLIDALEANNGLTLDEYGNVTYENDYSTAKEAINTIAEFSSGISSAFQSLMSGDIFGAIMGVGGAIAKFFENLFGIGDAQVQKQQDKIISSNKSLERAMTNLQHVLQDVAGKDKWDNLTEQIKNLRDQEKNNNLLYDMEMQKKHGDADKAESYRDQRDELKREIEDIIRGIREEIFGTADELASTLTDAMVEAFRNGENAARAWRDAVRGYVGDVLKQVLMANVIAPTIDDILKSFGIEEGKTSAEDIMALFTDANRSVELRNALFGAGDDLMGWFNNLAKPIQEMIGWNSSTSALTGGIQGITEDTARTLEGLSNSMLAQLVIANRSIQEIATSGFAQVQLSWFNDMLNQQRALRAAADSINSILTGSRDGTRSLQVRIE